MSRKVATLQIVAFAACLFFPSADALAQAKTTRKGPGAVTADPAPPLDRRYAASMKELSIPSTNGERMNGIMYLAAGAGVHPTVVLLHGFPGNEQNLDLAQSMRRAGWNVLYFHYRGAWGSEGDFSFSHAMEDTLAAIKFLRDPVNYVGLRVDTSNIVLVGHSMGGFMAAYAAREGFVIKGEPMGDYRADIVLDVQGLILISPWNLAYDVAADKSSTAQQLADELNEWRGYQYSLHGFTAEAGMAEIHQNAPDWDLVDWAPNIVGRHMPVLLLYGKYENDDEEGFTPLRDAFRSAVQQETDNSSEICCYKMPAHPFTTIALPTDHAYSDHRIALQSAVVEWLERLRTSKPKVR